MICVQWVDTEGTHTETATNEQTAKAREVQLRVRGVRHVVWYFIADEENAA